MFEGETVLYEERRNIYAGKVGDKRGISMITEKFPRNMKIRENIRRYSAPEI